MEHVTGTSTPPTHIESLLGPESFPSWKRQMEATLDPSTVTSIIQEVTPAQWTPPLTASQARRIDPSHWRGCAQEGHHMALQKSFLMPLYIKRDAEGVTTLDIPLQFNTRGTKTIAEMDGDDVRQFCYKDCAIYQNVAPFAELEIFEKIYERWWPGRAKGEEVGQGGVGRGSFFGMFMKISPPGVQMQEIANLHAELAQKLKQLESEVPAPQVMAFDPRHGKERETGLYRLRGSFENVFVVLDRRDWEREGVCCVFRDGETAGMYAVDGLEEEVCDGVVGVEEWDRLRVYRVSLERAVDIIAGRDEERRERGKGKEWNDMKEQFLGSSEILSSPS